MQRLVLTLLLICSAFAFPATSHADITTSLIGYWTLDGKNTNWNTNTTSDLSGNTNTGTLVGMSTTTSPVPGRLGQALSFTGANTVSVVNATSLNLTGSPVTIAAWIKLPANSGTDRQIIRKGDSLGYFILLNSGNKFAMSTSDISAEYNNGFAYAADNLWHHVVGVFDGTNCILYKDGVQQTSYACGAITNDSTGLTIGSWKSQLQFFTGLIDDARVYSRALSATDVMQLYKQGAAKFATSPVNSLTSGLIGYWTFDGKDTNWAPVTGGTTNDLSGNGKTGTLLDMSTSTSPIAGKIGQGILFNNPTNAARVKLANDIIGVSSASYCSWLNPNRTVNVGILFSNRLGFTVFRNISRDIQFSSDGGVTNLTSGGIKVLDNKWTHVCVTRDVTGSAKIYINGIINISGSSGTPVVGQDANTYIGNSNVQNQSFPGTMDDVRIYNRELSANEIAALYKQGAAKLATSAVNSLTSGLVGYWTFDGKDTNWATGVVNSLISSTNNGLATNMSTTSAPIVGKIGQAFKFDGVDDHVSIPRTNIDFERTDTFSFSVWAKWNDVVFSNQGSGFLGRLNGLTGTSFGECKTAVAGQCNANSAFLVLAGGTTFLAVSTPTSSVSPNKWTQVTVTYDGSSTVAGVKIYINGVSQTITTQTNTPLSTTIKPSINWEIGTASSVTWLSGIVDDVRMYNRVLAASEITQLYKMGASTAR